MLWVNGITNRCVASDAITVQQSHVPVFIIASPAKYCMYVSSNEYVSLWRWSRCQAEKAITEYACVVYSLQLVLFQRENTIR